MEYEGSDAEKSHIIKGAEYADLLKRRLPRNVRSHR